MDHRVGVDLDQDLRVGESVDDEAGAAGVHTLEMPAGRLVDRFAMAAMQDVDRELADVIDRGAIIAAFVLGFCETAVASLIDPGLTLAASYLLFILVLLFRPEGLFGRKAT